MLSRRQESQTGPPTKSRMISIFLDEGVAFYVDPLIG